MGTQILPTLDGFGIHFGGKGKKDVFQNVFNISSNETSTSYPETY